MHLTFLRKTAFSLSLLLLSVLVTHAQTPINFVRTWEPMTPQSDPTILETLTIRRARQSTVYFDGLGRPIQNVLKQGSLNTAAGYTSAFDLVSTVNYDALGREEKKYLPFVAHSRYAGSPSPTDGSYKPNAIIQQEFFYSDGNSLSPINGQGDTKYYSQTVFEASPLNRVDKVMAPGESWVGANRGITSGRYFNTALDEVRIWNVTDNGTLGDLGTYSSPGVYAAGKLYKNSTTDEMGNQVLEFTDMEGKVILKKVQELSSVSDLGGGKNHTGWLNTYYIYDDLGQLRCVIQPEGVRLISTTSWVFSHTAILFDQCFRYAYDKRGRLIVKKVPGAEEVRMVYDARDRLVLTQDGNMRQATKKQWLFTHYDSYNRPIKTGIITDNLNYDNLLYHFNEAYNNFTSYPNLDNYPGYELLTEMGYDSYKIISGINYSSTYDVSFKTSSLMNLGYGTSPDYAIEPIASTIALGMPTRTLTKVLGTTDTYLSGVIIYDEKGRVIQTKTSNLSGGLDIVSNQYSWNGAQLHNVVRQQVVASPDQETIVATKYNYDNLWRQESVEKKVSHSLVDNGALPASFKTTAVLKYDALGQLKDKNLGNKPTAPGNPLANLSHHYNIRGWLLGINKDFINVIGTDRYFSMELGYDRNTFFGSQTNLYNGNIASTNWKTAGEDDVIRKLNFTYDKVNRLLSGNYSQNVGTMLDFSTTNLTYDPNGNIKTMRHMGWKPGGSVEIDNLVYRYGSYSNRLKSVQDLASNPALLLGDFKTSANHTQVKDHNTQDYTYDVNGNMVRDLNKDITTTAGGNGITYNHLNLPYEIKVRKTLSTERGTITYTYDATGNKLRKHTEDISTTGTTISTTTDYMMGLVYETRKTNGVADYENRLQLIGHEEGRIRFTPIIGATPAKLSYDYFLKDHLGNVRMVLTEDVDSETYPTLTFEGASGSPEVQSQDKYWENKSGQSVNVVASRTSHSSGTNAMLTRKSLGAIGATKLLKVMSGDKIQSSVQFYYTTTNANNTGAGGINSLIANIATLVGNSISPSGVIKSGAASLGTDLSAQTALVNALNTPNSTSGSNQAPKAYLHILLFNEQFQFDATNSKVVPVTYTVGSWGTISRIGANAVTVKKNGYAYIYFSNESDELVYFDNFNLTHERGPILEETHYYPFGLTMAGISSRAMGKLENKRKFNDGSELENKEFSDGIGLELYSTAFRGYDPQIGRFHQIDPLAVLANDWSPYNYGLNNPLLYNDPLGLTPEEPSREDDLFNGGAYTDWVRDEKTGRVYFDPDVHGPKDVKPGQVYIGPEIIITDENGNPIGFGNDQGGISYNVDLAEVTVTGRPLKGWGLAKAWYNPLNGVATGATMQGSIRHNKFWWFDDNWKFKSTKLLKPGADGKFINGVQGYRIGYASAAAKAKVLTRAGNVVGLIGVGMSIADMSVNGVNAQNATDLTIGMLSFAPGIGWIIGGSYFIADIISKSATGNSLVENITGEKYD
jgi:RHS repeat-associated protein